MKTTKTTKYPKYSLIFITREEYRGIDKKYSFTKQGNSLEVLLKYMHRHTKRRTRNPWEYVHILKNCQFNPYRDSETLLFISLKR